MRPNLPTGPVLDFLIADYTGRGHIYSPAKIAAKVHADESDVLATLLLLTDEPLGALRGQWVFYGDDDEEFDLDPEDVATAIRDEEFYHPLSGARIYSFQQSIGLHYEPTAAFEDAVRRRREGVR